MLALSALVWVVLCAYTLSPFDFATPHYPDTGIVGLPASFTDAAILVGHAAAFFLAGALTRLLVRVPRHIRAAALAGSLICVGLEFGQIFVPSRHPALLDLAANLAGFLIGALRPFQWSMKTVRRTAPRAIAIWALLSGVLLFAPHLLVSLDDWNADYPLVIGQESEGPLSKARVTSLAIYNRALEPGDILSAGPAGVAAAPSTGLLSAYDFARSSGSVAPIEAGPLLRSRAVGQSFASVASPSDIVRAIEQTGSFTLDVRCRCPDPAGAGTLVAISESIYRRNVALLQRDGGFEFDVRNRLTGPNGARFALYAPEAIGGGETHIVARYESGIYTLFVNGRERASLDLVEPSVMVFFGSGSVSHGVLALVTALAFLCVWPGRHSRMLAPDLCSLIAAAYVPLVAWYAIARLFQIGVAPSLMIWLGPMQIVSALILRADWYRGAVMAESDSSAS